MGANCVEFALANPARAPRIAAGIAAAEDLLRDGRRHTKAQVVRAIMATGLAESTASNILRCGRKLDPPLWSREGSHQRPYFRAGGDGGATPKGRRAAAKVRPVKVYDLYPGPRGFTGQTRHYHGTIYHVAAPAAKQAQTLAERGKWANPAAAALSGVVAIYRRDLDHGNDLWCGCTTHDFAVRHGQTERSIRAAIDKHLRSVHGK